MNASQLRYRVRQFWEIFRSTPTTDDLDRASLILTPQQMALFRRMHPSEQAHSIRVLKALQRQGKTHPDLIVASLLHDVGKIHFPLNPLERTLIVLTKAVLPKQISVWGKGVPRGWRRPFVVSAQHPEWGAQIAAEAGVSPLAVTLIRRHQDKLTISKSSQEENHLSLLQEVDNKN